MGKQFGDDESTLQIISNVIKGYMNSGKKLKAGDIDSMEDDIFKRLGNGSNQIALDQFHTRLVSNANKKSTGLDKFGM